MPPLHDALRQFRRGLKCIDLPVVLGMAQVYEQKKMFAEHSRNTPVNKLNKKPNALRSSSRRTSAPGIEALCGRYSDWRTSTDSNMYMSNFRAHVCHARRRSSRDVLPRTRYDERNPRLLIAVDPH